MSLESILQRISDESNAQKDRIIKVAREEARRIIALAREEGQKLYQEMVEKEKAACEGRIRKAIVSARLEAKKRLLEARRELVESVFNKLKSDLDKKDLKIERVGHDKVREVAAQADIYIDRLRFGHEAEVAKILFG